MLAAVNHHYIRTSFNSKYPSIFGLTPQEFESRLKILSKWGRFISQQELRHLINKGQELPDRSIVITFDDGLKEQYDLALPILKKLNIPAIFFISTKVYEQTEILNVHKIHLVRSKVSTTTLLKYMVEFVSDRNIDLDLAHSKMKGVEHYKYDSPDHAMLKYALNFLLNKDELNHFINDVFETEFKGEEEAIHENLYMSKNEVQLLGQMDYIGSHSHDHDPLGLKDVQYQREQAIHSKRILEGIADTEIYGFSYPYGGYEACKGLHTVLKQSGYDYAFTMERAINCTLDNQFYLSRFDNNDMPGGKSFSKNSDDFFKEYNFASWKF